MQCSKSMTYINILSYLISFYPHSNPVSRYFYYFYFTDEETDMSFCILHAWPLLQLDYLLQLNLRLHPHMGSPCFQEEKELRGSWG